MEVVLYTVPEVAAILGVSRRQVENYMKEGRLRRTKLSNRAVRVSKTELKAFLASCERVR